MNFLNLPNPSGLTRPCVHSASNRNEHEKEKSNVSGEKSPAGRRTDNLNAICEPIF
jgi:hypothetical protein